MTESHSTPAVYAALVGAQKQMGALFKDSKNPHFRSNYASLAAVLDVIMDPLVNNGFTLQQTVEREDDRLVLQTILLHESGEMFDGGTYPLSIQSMNDPQKVGSALTYARRYSLMSLFALAAEDDDGNDAAGYIAPAARPPAKGTGAPTAAQIKTAQGLLKELRGVDSDAKADAETQKLAKKKFKELTGKEMSDKIIKPLLAEKDGFK